MFAIWRMSELAPVVMFNMPNPTTETGLSGSMSRLSEGPIHQLMFTGLTYALLNNNLSAWESRWIFFRRIS